MTDVGPGGPGRGVGDEAGSLGAGAATATSPRRTSVSAAAATRKTNRRARLTLTRVDPWSVLKFSFVYSLAALIVLLVAVLVLYSIVDAMGVIDSIRSFITSIESESNDTDITQWLSLSRVMLVALLVGVVNVVLFTAFATLTAFIYNICNDIVGGVEVTLSERP
jgi:hypothetical protein